MSDRNLPRSSDSAATGATPVHLRAVLQPRGPAAAIVLTDAQLAAIIPDRKTPPIRVTVNEHTFSARISRMGGETLIGFNKAMRTACGVQPGQELEVQIVLDEGAFEVEVPQQLAKALDAEPQARAAFERIAYTHQKEFVRWVNEAKREDTRNRRIGETLRMLREGRVSS